MRFAVLALAAVLASPAVASASTASGAHGAVAADEAIAADVGLDVLRTGGNAVDAAVAIGYTLAVTYPAAGNIGGGGFMLIRMADGTTRFIDFRETAPAAATATMYVDATGNVVPERSTVGALSVAVPGTVAGLEYARDHYGTRERHQLITPAIALADEGYPLSPAAARLLARDNALLSRFGSTAAIFTRGGAAPAAGSVFKQPALAATLRAIDRGGAAAFYTGDVAQRIVAGVRANGGILTAADLAGYTIAQRAPIDCAHRGDSVLSAPPPSSGGVVMCEVLGIIGDRPAGAPRSVADAHLELEAERRAFADRGSALGDPDFFAPPVAQLLAPAYAAQQRASISPTHATPSSAIHGLAVHEGTNTTSYAVVDAGGNAVDVTYTLNSSFGSGLVAGDTGVLLNDEMDDFTSKPGVPNQFGLVQGSVNAIGPRRRPLSSMAPTIVVDRDGRVVLVAGAAGGPRIITTVLDIVRGVLDFGLDAGPAVDAPRVHEQWLPDEVDAEPNALDARTARALTAMGYTIRVGSAESNANAVLVRPDGTRVAAHDDRTASGAALAY